MQFKNDLSKKIFSGKYYVNDDKIPEDSIERVLEVIGIYYPEIVEEIKKYIQDKDIGLAGGLWRAALNWNKNVSVINCTTLGKINDNLEDISEGWYKWAKYAAYGQGEGADFSNLRPKGSIVHNSSKYSTGAVSFMTTYDAILRIIAQQGRRGASLISLHIDHPDIPEFISVKDKKVKIVNSGGEIVEEWDYLDTANISIQMSDAFMKALEKDTDWVFTYKNKYEEITNKTMKAKEVWNMITSQAWKTGDPGLQFMDIISKYSNSDYLSDEIKIESSNACGEVPNDRNNVCLLSSKNLAKAYNQNEEDFRRSIQLLTYILDAFRRYEIDENRSPIEAQKLKLIEAPRIGIGVTGLGDYFIRKQIKYGSEKSIEEVRKLFQIIASESYKTSYEIAKRDGYSFKYYNKEKYKQSPFVKRMLEEGLIEDYHLDYQAHVTKLSIAPTGSLTEIVEAGAGGIEPIFSKYFVRRERATTGEWKEWFTFNNLVRDILEEQGKEVTKENADALNDDYWVTAHDVDNLQKIKLIGEIQKYIDGAISVTYNLNEDCSVKDIKDIYYEAWRHELKGVTVYREGSKAGVLITDANYEKSQAKQIIPEEENRPKTIKRTDAPGRPEYLECDIHQINVNKERHIVLVGRVDDGSLYEIFVTPDPENKIDLGKYTRGVIQKVKKGHYRLLGVNGKNECIVDNIGKTFNETYSSLSRFISMGLRLGHPLQFIVTQLQKDTSFNSFEKAVARVLKKYIKEGEKVEVSEVCPICGSDNLIYKEGCLTCLDCGNGKCD